MLFRTIDKRPKDPGVIVPQPPIVRRPTSSSTTTIVYDPEIPDGSILYEQIQDVSANRLLGRNNASSGPMEEIFVGDYLTLTGTTLSFVGPLDPTDGGTGFSSYATGDILYASSATALSKLPIGTNGQVLASNGTNPVWQTNVSSFPGSPANGDLIYYNGSAWATLTRVTNTQTGSTSNTVTLPTVPAIYSEVCVYINGVLKEEGEDYTISSNVITLVYNLLVTDKVTTKYYT